MSAKISSSRRSRLSTAVLCNAQASSRLACPCAALLGMRADQGSPSTDVTWKVGACSRLALSTGAAGFEVIRRLRQGKIRALCLVGPCPGLEQDSRLSTVLVGASGKQIVEVEPLLLADGISSY